MFFLFRRSPSNFTRFYCCMGISNKDNELQGLFLWGWHALVGILQWWSLTRPQPLLILIITLCMCVCMLHMKCSVTLQVYCFSYGMQITSSPILQLHPKLHLQSCRFPITSWSAELVRWSLRLGCVAVPPARREVRIAIVQTKSQGGFCHFIQIISGGSRGRTPTDSRDMPALLMMGRLL